jgi:hypothetical protein
MTDYYLKLTAVPDDVPAPTQSGRSKVGDRFTASSGAHPVPTTGRGVVLTPDSVQSGDPFIREQTGDSIEIGNEGLLLREEGIYAVTFSFAVGNSAGDATKIKGTVGDDLSPLPSVRFSREPLTYLDPVVISFVAHFPANDPLYFNLEHDASAPIDMWWDVVIVRLA